MVNLGGSHLQFLRAEPTHSQRKGKIRTMVEKKKGKEICDPSTSWTTDFIGSFLLTRGEVEVSEFAIFFSCRTRTKYERTILLSYCNSKHRFYFHPPVREWLPKNQVKWRPTLDFFLRVPTYLKPIGCSPALHSSLPPFLTAIPQNLIPHQFFLSAQYSHYSVFAGRTQNAWLSEFQFLENVKSWGK